MTDADYARFESRYAERVEAAHARRSDPVTSSLAAASVTNLTETKRRVLALVKECGPLTRDLLIAVWREKFPTDRTTDQSIRSRLAELIDEGRLEPAGHTTNERGRKVQIVGLPRGPEVLF